MLMSSASESVCSRDGEGDTELDLDVNILPPRGCPGPGPPTPRGRHRLGASGEGGRATEGCGEAASARGFVRRRGAFQLAEAPSRPGQDPLPESARGVKRGAEGSRGAQPAPWIRGWGGPGGNSAGRAAQSPAGSISLQLPATVPILVAPIGWEGQVS